MWRDEQYKMYRKSVKGMTIGDAVRKLYYEDSISKYRISKILDISEFQVDKILGYV